MFFIFLIGLLVIGVVIVVNFVKQKKIPLDHVIMFTGTMGSGKTLAAVNKVVGALVAKIKLLILLSNIWPWKWKNIDFKHIKVYSNIPLSYHNYIPLESEHLLRDVRMFQDCVILTDEFGSFLNQYDWNNPYVIEHITTFVRFARHWLNAYLVITDQTSESIPKPIRDRLNYEYHLCHCRTWMFFWKKIDVHEVQHITSDVQNVISVEDPEHPPYILVRFYRKKKKQKYETRCYRPSYESGFVFKRSEDDSSGLYTRYLLDFEPNKDFAKLYKEDKKSARMKVLNKSIKG